MLPEERLVFVGMSGILTGSSDILRQVAIVIQYWSTRQCFPIEFEQINMGESVQDQTVKYIQVLNENGTPIILHIY